MVRVERVERVERHGPGDRRYPPSTHPRLGPLGTRKGATTPTSAHRAVKQIIGSASECETMTAAREGRGDGAARRKDEPGVSSRRRSASMAAQPARRPAPRPRPLNRGEAGDWSRRSSPRAPIGSAGRLSALQEAGLDGCLCQQVAAKRIFKNKILLILTEMIVKITEK